jgi:hypothetical protein
VGIFFYGPVTDFNSVLNAVTKSKMTGNIKLNRSKVQQGGCKILLSQVFRPTCFFNPSGY